MASWRHREDAGFPSTFREALRFGTPWTASSRSSPSPDALGDGFSSQNPNDGCSYARSIKSRCFTEVNEEGKPVKKCEKTEQLLRKCVGKPQEIVESKSEYTEEELPNGWSVEVVPEESHVVPYEEFPSAPWKPFQGTDPFSKGLNDGIESFFQAAEEMINDAFNQLGFYRHEEKSDSNGQGTSRRFFPRHHRNPAEDGVSPPDNRSKPHKVDLDSRTFDEV